MCVATGRGAGELGPNSIYLVRCEKIPNPFFVFFRSFLRLDENLKLPDGHGSNNYQSDTCIITDDSVVTPSTGTTYKIKVESMHTQPYYNTDDNSLFLRGILF